MRSPRNSARGDGDAGRDRQSTPRNRHSTSSCRAMRTRVPPSAARTASSRVRPTPRASSRLAMLAHASSSTNSTTPPSTSDVVRRSASDDRRLHRVDRHTPTFVGGWIGGCSMFACDHGQFRAGLIERHLRFHAADHSQYPAWSEHRRRHRHQSLPRRRSCQEAERLPAECRRQGTGRRRRSHADGLSQNPMDHAANRAQPQSLA